MSDSNIISAENNNLYTEEYYVSVIHAADNVWSKDGFKGSHIHIFKKSFIDTLKNQLEEKKTISKGEELSPNVIYQYGRIHNLKTSDYQNRATNSMIAADHGVGAVNGSFDEDGLKLDAEAGFSNGVAPTAERSGKGRITDNNDSSPFLQGFSEKGAINFDIAKFNGRDDFQVQLTNALKDQGISLQAGVVNGERFDYDSCGVFFTARFLKETFKGRTVSAADDDGKLFKDFDSIVGGERVFTYNEAGEMVSKTKGNDGDPTKCDAPDIMHLHNFNGTKSLPGMVATEGINVVPARTMINVPNKEEFRPTLSQQAGDKFAESVKAIKAGKVKAIKAGKEVRKDMPKNLFKDLAAARKDKDEEKIQELKAKANGWLMRDAFTKRIGDVITYTFGLSEKQINQVATLQKTLTAISLLETEMKLKGEGRTDLKEIKDIYTAEQKLHDAAQAAIKSKNQQNPDETKELSLANIQKFKQGFLKAAIEIVDNGKGPPRDVPQFADLTVTLGFITQEQKQSVLIAQAAARTVEASKGKNPSQIIKDRFNDRSVQNDDKNKMFYRNFIDNEKPEIKQAQAINHLADIVNAFIAHAKEKNIAIPDEVKKAQTALLDIGANLYIKFRATLGENKKATSKVDNILKALEKEQPTTLEEVIKTLEKGVDSIVAHFNEKEETKDFAEKLSGIATKRLEQARAPEKGKDHVQGHHLQL